MAVNCSWYVSETELCTRHFDSYEELKQHFKSDHNNLVDGRIYCYWVNSDGNICGQGSRDHNSRTNHINHMHCKNMGLDHSCTSCGKTFKDRHGLKQHMKNHERPLEPIICPTCGKGTSNQANANKHAKTHLLDPQKQHCRYCGKAATNGRNDNISRHERTCRKNPDTGHAAKKAASRSKSKSNSQEQQAYTPNATTNVGAPHGYQEAARSATSELSPKQQYGNYIPITMAQDQDLYGYQEDARSATSEPNQQQQYADYIPNTMAQDQDLYGYQEDARNAVSQTEQPPSEYGLHNATESGHIHGLQEDANAPTWGSNLSPLTMRWNQHDITNTGPEYVHQEPASTSHLSWPLGDIDPQLLSHNPVEVARELARERIARDPAMLANSLPPQPQFVQHDEQTPLSTYHMDTVQPLPGSRADQPIDVDSDAAMYGEVNPVGQWVANDSDADFLTFDLPQDFEDKVLFPELFDATIDSQSQSSPPPSPGPPSWAGWLATTICAQTK